MAEDRLLVQLTKSAFLLRLGALLIVLLGERPHSPLAFVVFTVVTSTSALGLWSTHRVVAAATMHPLLVVVDVLLSGAIALAVGSDSPLLLFSLGTAALIGLLFDARVAPLLVAILSTTWLLGAFSDDSARPIDYLLMPTTYVVIASLGFIARRLHEASIRDFTKAEIAERALSRERERDRLARDLHDTVTKTVRGIELSAAAVPLWMDRDINVAKEQVLLIQQAAGRAADEARALLNDMRDRRPRTMSEQLTALVDDYRALGLTIDAELACDDLTPGDATEQLVAIAQEALENVLRHAHATRVRVEAGRIVGGIRISLSDDGIGFDASRVARAGHFGLLGMRERAALIGADLTIVSRPSGGTTLRIDAPTIAPAAQEESA